MHQKPPSIGIRGIKAMEDDYGNLFGKMDRREPPAGLLDSIIFRINEEGLRTARIRFVCFSFLSLAALSALIPAWNELRSEATQSGFLQFFSLLFSDASIIAVYWQDFTMTVAESLPVFGISAVLAAMFAFLLSMRFMVRDRKIIFNRSHLAIFK
jgi:hypothetical protein